MNPRIPRIGFDRFIDIDWLGAALQVRLGNLSRSDLRDILDRAGLGDAAKKKTQTVLNRLWLEPRSELIGFADRGVELLRGTHGCSVAILSWGMAIATYPFFGQVAELVGRLSSMQGDCASAEIHRRMSETYGEREGTYRMTNMVLQSQANWGFVERVDQGKRLVRCAAIPIVDESLIAWLIEAALRFKKRPISVLAMQSMAVMFPFKLNNSIAYVASKSKTLELGSEGSAEQSIALQIAS
jgi:hypothetical protein